MLAESKGPSYRTTGQVGRQFTRGQKEDDRIHRTGNAEAAALKIILDCKILFGYQIPISQELTQELTRACASI